MSEYDEIAIISYIGSEGVSRDCTEAILDCLSRGDKLEKVTLLSSPLKRGNHDVREHGFYLRFENIGWFAVLPGYASGYGGTGPNELSRILCIFHDFRIHVSEVFLTQELFEKLRFHHLSYEDLDFIENASKIRGVSGQYILNHALYSSDASSHLNSYDVRVPLSILHPDILHLFPLIIKEPTHALRDAYIVVENKLRELTGINESSTKLIGKALKPKDGLLVLRNNTDPGEQSGLELFTKGIFQLHRNPRMHRKTDSKLSSDVSEFLVINHVLHMFDKLEKK